MGSGQWAVGNAERGTGNGEAVTFSPLPKGARGAGHSLRESDSPTRNSQLATRYGFSAAQSGTPGWMPSCGIKYQTVENVSTSAATKFKIAPRFTI